MAITYEQMLKQAISKGQVVDASKWFESTFKNMSHSTDTIIDNAKSGLKTSLEIGKMYLFHYDPKHKAKLPLYDRFPLIFPFDHAERGFYGINFHYIPHMQRARLLDSLMGLVNDKALDNNTRLNLNYRLLKSVSKAKLFEPCVKRYLNSHVRSRFLQISPSEWAKALMLPLDDFVYRK